MGDHPSTPTVHPTTPPAAQINAGRVRLADSERRLGPHSAVTRPRAAIAINQKDAIAHYNLGVLLENKADYGGAEQHYRRARAIDPEEHADAHCELAGQPRPSWCL